MRAHLLLEAEWIKSIHRPIYQGAMAVLLGFSIMPLILTAMAFAVPSTRGFTMSTLAFDNGADTAVSVIKIFSPLVVVLLIAVSLGSEYSQDTWKLVVPLVERRASLVLAKIGVTLVLLLLGLLVALLLYLAVLTLTGAVLDIPPAQGHYVYVDPLKFGAFILLRALLFAAVSALICIATRSAQAAALVPIFGLPFLEMAATRTHWLARTLPGVHLLNLEAHWRYGGEDKALRLVFGGAVSPVESALFVLAAAVLCLGGAMLLFERRDLA